MIERFASVIYWASCVAAALTCAVFVAIANKDGPWVLALGAVAAGVIWVAGRAVRYVLAGR